MCLSPILIKNPNYGLDPTKGYNYLHDCTHTRIYVPCGHCRQCIAVNQMYYVQRIQMEALKNYLYMGTITYNEEMLPRLETSQGYKFNYTSYEDITKMLKRMRQKNVFGIPFRYFYVTERGGKGG